MTTQQELTVRGSLLETLVRRLTAFRSVAELVAAQKTNGYVPTVIAKDLRGAIRAEHITLAQGLQERGIKVWTGN